MGALGDVVVALQSYKAQAHRLQMGRHISRAQAESARMSTKPNSRISTKTRIVHNAHTHTVKHSYFCAARNAATFCIFEASLVA